MVWQGLTVIVILIGLPVVVAFSVGRRKSASAGGARSKPTGGQPTGGLPGDEPV